MFGCCEKILANSRVAQDSVIEAKLLNELPGIFGWPETSTLVLSIPDHRSSFGLQFAALKLLAETWFGFTLIFSPAFPSPSITALRIKTFIAGVHWVDF